MNDAAIPVAVLDGVDAPILLFQVDGTFIAMNRAAAVWLRWRADASANIGLASLLAPADEKIAQAALASLADGRSQQAFVTRTRPEAGTAGLTCWTVRRVDAAKPYIVVTGQAGSGVDALAAGTDDADGIGLGTLINAVPVPSVVTRVSDGFIHYFNEAAALRFEIPMDRAASRYAPDFYVNPADRQATIARVARDGHLDATELALKDTRGVPFFALLSVRMLRVRGEPALMSCIYDISEFKRVEQAKRDSDTRYRILAENAGVGIAQLDADWQCVYANPALCRMLEVAGHEEIGDRIADFASADSKARLLAERSIRRAGQPSTYEIDVVGQRGTKRSLLVSVAPLMGEGGQFAGSLGSYTDITELKATQHALARATDQAETANRAKSDFLARMSHELRTPLNAILGFSEIIRSQYFGPASAARYANYADDIHSSGSHLLQVVNDILDLSKVEAGRIELRDSVFAPAEIAAEALAVVAGQAEQRGHGLKADFPVDLPRLRADRRHVQQMLLNLLSNAIKFTERDGNVTVRGRRDGGAVLISVADTGIGIAEADIARALQPFGQVANPLIRDQSGTGLGLAVVRALIERHGGSLEIQSAPGQGTVVTLIFPAARVMATG